MFSKRIYRANNLFKMQPRGTQCLTCRNKIEHCGTKDFSQMPIIETKGTVKFVNCLEFERK